MKTWSIKMVPMPTGGPLIAVVDGDGKVIMTTAEGKRGTWFRVASKLVAAHNAEARAQNEE